MIDLLERLTAPRGRHRLSIRFGSAALALVAVGCGGPPDFDQTLATVRSWTASTLLAARDRHAGAIGARYAAGLRERASAALTEQRAALATAARTSGDRAAARGATDSLARAIEVLRQETDR